MVHWWRLYIYVQRLCVFVYGVGHPPCAFQMLSTRHTHFGSLLKKQNTKYRLGLISHQANISRVRTTYGENIAISESGIGLDRRLIEL